MKPPKVLQPPIRSEEPEQWNRGGFGKVPTPNNPLCADCHHHFEKHFADGCKEPDCKCSKFNETAK